MKPATLHPGNIMHLDSAGCGGEGWFGSCLLVVTNPRPWGTEGYVKGPGDAGIAFYRVQWQNMEPTGGKVPVMHPMAQAEAPENLEEEDSP